MTRRLLLIALVASAAAVLVAASSDAAHAAAPRLQGWWTSTSTGSAPGGAPAPLVPAHGLLIQGGTTQPSAYAALAYDVGTDVTVGQLTLAVAPNSGTTPGAKLEICRLASPTFSPEQGGPMTDAPKYDCARTVSAAPNAKGTAYAFSVSSLVSNGTLAVAILPADPTARVVLSQPSGASLPTYQTASQPADTFDTTVSQPAPRTSTSGNGQTAQVRTVGGGLPAAPSSPSGAPAPQVAAAPSPTAAAVAAQPLAATTASGATKKAVPAVIAALVVVAAVAWTYAGRSAGRDPADGALSD